MIKCCICGKIIENENDVKHLTKDYSKGCCWDCYIDGAVRAAKIEVEKPEFKEWLNHADVTT